MATPYEVGLLLNFGPRARYKWMVFTSSRKASRTWLRNQPGAPKNADLR
jgi:hypothetical protein